MLYKVRKAGEAEALTYGFDMDTMQLWAQGLCFMDTHVSCYARSPCWIVNGDKAFPLLHSYWDIRGYAQAFLLHLACSMTVRTITNLPIQSRHVPRSS